MIDIQENRENDDIVDTDIEMYTNNIVGDTTKVKESQQNIEGLEKLVVQYTKNTQ